VFLLVGVVPLVLAMRFVFTRVGRSES
jgi:hypothetical protein